MTAVYEREGIRFLYPENWTLDDQSEPQGLICAASLEAPGGALWTVNVEAGSRDLQQLAEEIVATMRQEYEDLESEPLAGGGEDALPDGLPSAGYELHFYCVDMVVKAVVRCCHWEGRTVMIMTQAEARDHDQLAPVFRAITTSLLSDPATPN